MNDNDPAPERQAQPNSRDGQPAPAAQPAATTQPAASAAVSGQQPWPGAFAAIGQAFNQIKQNPQPAIVFVAAYVVLAAADQLLAADKGNTGLTVLLGMVFLLALPIYAVAVADRRPISISEFMTFDMRFLYLLAVSFLLVLIFGVSALLLLIPLIWTIAWFSMTAYAITDKRLGPIQGLKESKRLAENHKAKVWGLIGASIILTIPATIVTFIPYIGIAAIAFLQVLISAATAILYRWLQRQQA